MNKLSGLAGMIREIPTKYGKYAVMGNHEFYAGLQEALKVTEDAGFKVLRGEGLNIPGVINLAGVDDHAEKKFKNFEARPDSPPPYRFVSLVITAPITNTIAIIAPM
jgi:predicted MPP superfamily phosphohydrolase